MRLEIRLLGTVELRVNGRAVTPGSAKRRAVLAGLSLAANRQVTLSQLVEMVWTAAPPASAMSNLRSHAAGLRRSLGDRLAARRRAYELRLEPHELDVFQFQRLAEEGRAQLAAEDPIGAMTTLTAALALWRGAAGDGVPRGTALDNRWASLEEQRLHVFEELTEARLATGQHGDLLAQLREHLTDHPLRERAWGQLMLALYRYGDVPAALTAYRKARATLDEQLGIEPGEELAALHRAMLERAPEVSYSRPSRRLVTSPTSVTESGPTRAVGPPIPRELPADVTTFVGRDREIATVVATVTGTGPAVVVITGPPGSGRTALAVHAAHTVAREFPDGQVFLDLDGRFPVAPEDVLARVLRALGVAPADVPDGVDERAAWLRTMTAGRRLLLVINGVAGAAWIRPLLPAGPGPALVVVGHRYLGGLDGVTRVVLRPLAPARSRELLASLAGADRLAAEQSATDELIRLCAGSVLALRIAGSRLARWPALPVAALVGQLADARDRLGALAYDDLSVRDSLARAVALVHAEDEVAVRLLELTAAHPPFPAVDAAAIRLGVSGRRVRRALEKLIDAHLADRDDSGAYQLAPLVPEYIMERLVSDR